MKTAEDTEDAELGEGIRLDSLRWAIAFAVLATAAKDRHFSAQTPC